MTFAVIFRATLAQPDEDYAATAQRLRALAFEKYGCLDFYAVTDAGQEIAVSYWPSLEHIAAWKADPEHLAAQARGRGRWYASYSVEVHREYAHGDDDKR